MNRLYVFHRVWAHRAHYWPASSGSHPLWNACFGVVYPSLCQHQSLDFVAAFVHTQVRFAPGPALAVPMMTDLPLTFTVDFLAGAIHHDVFRLIGIACRQ